MKAFKFFITILIGVLLMEIVVPYPHPTYNKELLLKELANGTFFSALNQDIKAHQELFDRYIERDRSIDKTLNLAKGDRHLDNLDIETIDMAKIKEFAWLPFYVEAGEASKEEIYYPKRYYTRYEFTNDDIQTNTPDVGVRFNEPYYDKNNAGLFGVKEIKDGNGNVVSKEVWFFSLKDYSTKKLGRIPSDLVHRYYDFAGYVKGCALLVFDIDSNNHNFTYLSFDFSGNRYRIDNINSRTLGGFGDFGAFAALKNGKTLILNYKLQKEAEFDGDFISSSAFIVETHTPYPFGVRIGNSVYKMKSETQSYKFTKTRNGWRVKVVNKPIWKYRKAHRYDYSTDGWQNEPLKFLHYNLIKNGVATYDKKRLPCDRENTFCLFTGSDGYADFVEVRPNPDSNKGKKLYHTYDFKVWNEVPIQKAADGFFNNWGRIWVNGRSDDIVGFLPYSIGAIGYNNKIIISFEGFILRR